MRKVSYPAPSRRAMLRGELLPGRAAAESLLYVSSMVVSVFPDRRSEVLRRLQAVAGIEVHHVESHKIVVVMEADDAGVIGSLIAAIGAWEGVLSANMVFEQSLPLSELGE